MRFVLLLAAVAASTAGVPAMAAEDPAPPVTSAPRAGAPMAAPQPPSGVAPLPAAAARPTAEKSRGGDAPADAETREAKPGEVAEKTAKPAPPAAPPVVVKINLATQSMDVSVDGAHRYSWPVSSGRAGYPTPRGTWTAKWSSKMWYSRKYDNAPMPHAVFFTGGVAIHATYATGMLGRPASHGCVRLAPANAKTFYDLVQKRGLGNTQITVHGNPPGAGQRVSTAASRTERIDRTDVRRSAPRRAASEGLAASRNGVVYLRPGSPYAGRESFVHNGVRYVRVR